MTEQELTTRLRELLAMPAETEVLEFKEAKNGYDFTKLGKYFSALSNEANLKGKPYAWLVFGVNDKHQIVSTKFRANNRADLDHLKSEIAQKINSRINFVEIYELNNLLEGRVVMFQIPAAPQGIPVSFDGHYYGRDGEELSALNIEEMERIRKQIIQTDWSAMICNGSSINDLDDNALIVARQNFAIKNPRLREEIPKWDYNSGVNS